MVYVLIHYMLENYGYYCVIVMHNCVINLCNCVIGEH